MDDKLAKVVGRYISFRTFDGIVDIRVGCGEKRTLMRHGDKEKRRDEIS